MSHPTFDLDVLRTLVAGVELGSFAKAADRVGRSTAAVSAQLKRLEAQAGAPVLRKSGRGMALTPAGEVLLGYARRLLELNDEAQRVLRGAELQGEVRLGLQEDFGEGLLARVLSGFSRAHPRVRVEARLARNKRIGQFVRWLCHGLLVRPLHAVRRAGRRSGELVVECLPDAPREPAARQVRTLTREPEFARAASNFDQPATPGAEVAATQSPRDQSATKAA